jgi:hypothetical protein
VALVLPACGEPMDWLVLSHDDHPSLWEACTTGGKEDVVHISRLVRREEQEKRGQCMHSRMR